MEPNVGRRNSALASYHTVGSICPYARDLYHSTSSEFCLLLWSLHCASRYYATRLEVGSRFRHGLLAGVSSFTRFGGRPLRSGPSWRIPPIVPLARLLSRETGVCRTLGRSRRRSWLTTGSVVELGWKHVAWTSYWQPRPLTDGKFWT